MGNNLQLGDSQLTGILETKSNLSPWMQKLAEQEKAAIKDDLDEVANPESLSENNLFDSGDYSYVLQQQEDEGQHWSPVSSNYKIQATDDTSRILDNNNSIISQVNKEIEASVSELQDQGITLSELQNKLSSQFGTKIASRYIKNNFKNLSASFSDDLTLITLDDYDQRELSKGATTRINQVQYANSKLTNKEKIVKASSEDIKEFVNSQILHSASVDDIWNQLTDKYSSLETFTTKDELKKYYSNYKVNVYETIDAYIKNNLLDKTSSKEVSKELVKKFGEQNTNDFLATYDFNKVFGFKNSRNDGSTIQRGSTQETSKDVKSFSVEAKFNISAMKKEAFLQLTKGSTVAKVKTNLINKYGSEAVDTFEEKEGKTLNEVEHKLGYFYADSNVFDSCDEMASFLNKNSYNFNLLKKRSACYECVFNKSNVCTKTALILSTNPQYISKRDGNKIIQAIRDMKLLKAETIQAYQDELSSNHNNVPVIKSVISKLKQSLRSEQDPFRKANSEQVKKDSGKEFHSCFDATTINHFDVNSLNSTSAPMNINLFNLF